MNRDYRTGVRVSEQGVNNKLLNTGNIILHCEDFATKQWNNSKLTSNFLLTAAVYANV